MIFLVILIIISIFISSLLQWKYIYLIGICLVIGATAKSSQVRTTYLITSSYEGPTPVSALIHAATMVTAGVYLLMRSSPLIRNTVQLF